MSFSKQKRKVSWLFGLFLFLIALIIFWPWFHSGFLSYGDWWYILPSRASEYFNHFLIWDAARNLGAPLDNSVAHYGIHWIYGLVQTVFGVTSSVTSRFFWFIPFIVASFWGAWSFGYLLTKRRLAALITSILYTLNTFSLTTVQGGQMTIAVSYALAPVSLVLFIKLLQERKRGYQLLLAVTATAQVIYDVRMLAITVLAGLIYWFFILWGESVKQRNRRQLWLTVWQQIKLLLGSVLVALLLSAYWVVPTFFGTAGQVGVPTTHTDVGWLQSLSYSTLTNALATNHVWWPWSEGWLNSVQPLFLWGLILALVSLFYWKKSRQVPYLFVLILLGIFLVKGTNLPLDGVYAWLFTHVPGFVLFRDPAKFYMLLMLGLAPAAGLGASILVDQTIYRWKLPLAVIILVLILWPLKPALTGQLQGTFITKQVPTEYQQLETFYQQQSGWGRTFWLPTGQRYAPYTQQFPGVKGLELTDGIWSSFRDQTGSAGSVLTHPYANWLFDQTGMRWVGLPYDSEDEIYRHYGSRQSFLSELQGLNWLRAADNLVTAIPMFVNEGAKPEIYTAVTAVTVDQEALREAALPTLDVQRDVLLLTTRADGRQRAIAPAEKLKIISLNKDEFTSGDDYASWNFTLSEAFSGRLQFNQFLSKYQLRVDDQLLNWQPVKTETGGAVVVTDNKVQLAAGEHTLSLHFTAPLNLAYGGSFSDVKWGACQNTRGQLMYPDNFYHADENYGQENIMMLYSNLESPGCMGLNLGSLESGVYRVRINYRTESGGGPEIKLLYDEVMATGETFTASQGWAQAQLIVEVKTNNQATVLLTASSVIDQPKEAVATKVAISDIKVERLFDELPSWMGAYQADTNISAMPAVLSQERVEPGHYRLRLAATKDPFYLILNQAFATGWRVIGTEPTTHLNINVGLNGWYLPAGPERELEIIYGSKIPYRIGITISLASLMLVLFRLGQYSGHARRTGVKPRESK